MEETQHVGLAFGKGAWGGRWLKPGREQCGRSPIVNIFKGAVDGRALWNRRLLGRRGDGFAGFHPGVEPLVEVVHFLKGDAREGLERARASAAGGAVNKDLFIGEGLHLCGKSRTVEIYIARPCDVSFCKFLLSADVNDEQILRGMDEGFRFGGSEVGGFLHFGGGRPGVRLGAGGVCGLDAEGQEGKDGEKEEKGKAHKGGI